MKFKYLCIDEDCTVYGTNDEEAAKDWSTHFITINVITGEYIQRHDPKTRDSEPDTSPVEQFKYNPENYK